MQFGHLAIALSIATYDWSIETAVFCIGMHWLPNMDSLVVKAGLDKQAIRGALKLERLVRGKNTANTPEHEAMNDPFWIENGGFHCTVTHSIFFAFVVSLLIALFSVHYAAFASVSILAHYAADIGSTVGLPLLWPFTRKKFTLSLFRDTGWWGKQMLIGYYKQPMSWVLEGIVVIFGICRLSAIYL